MSGAGYNYIRSYFYEGGGGGFKDAQRLLEERREWRLVARLGTPSISQLSCGIIHEGRHTRIYVIVCAVAIDIHYI